MPKCVALTLSASTKSIGYATHPHPQKLMEQHWLLSQFGDCVLCLITKDEQFISLTPLDLLNRICVYSYVHMAIPDWRTRNMQMDNSSFVDLTGY